MRNQIGAVKLLAIGVVILTHTLPIHAQFSRSSKIAGTSPGSQQGFSAALSADGNTAIMGGWNDAGGAGAAWIYTRTGGNWSQQGAKLTANDAIGSAHQGWAVGLSGDGNTAIVGGSEDNKGVGAAWIYTRTNGVWTQQGKKLTATDPSGASAQGFAVALSADGNSAIVGGGADGSYSGAAWIYTRTGGVWTQQGSKLTPTDASGAAVFGYSVALSSDGGTALIGGIGDGRYAGAAWAFTRTAGVWHQQAKLTANDGFGIPAQGQSVALSADGNTALVGGSWERDSIGAAWIYLRTNGAWSQQGPKLAATDGDGQSLQGDSVALTSDGNTVVVGGSGDSRGRGAAWAFRRSAGLWSQFGAKLTDTTSFPVSKQGTSVAISGDGSTLLAGGPAENSGAGAGWIYSSSAPSLPAPTISAAAGSPQSTPIGVAFALTLQAKVLDGSGKAMTGAAVTFTSPASGPAAILSSLTATTDSNGIAMVGATANGIAGAYSVTATAPGVSSSAIFALTNTAPSGTPYITGGTPGQPRQNVAGYLGTQFTVGATSINITALGRLWLAGNNSTHMVKLVNAGTGADIPNASVTVNMAGGQANQYVYASLASPAALKANTIYYIVSQELNGGDAWFDYGPIATTAAAGVNRPIASSGSSYIQVAVPPATNQGYGGANFYYTLGTAAPAPPTVSITAPTGGTVSGRNLVVSATAAAAPGLIITGVQFKVDGTNRGAPVTASPYSISLDTTALAEGVHTLAAVATDSANNTAASAQVSVTVHNAPVGMPFLTVANFSSARNNSTGSLGFQLDVGAAPITVTALGRIFITGNSASHLLKLVLARDGSDVAGGSVTVNMQGGTSNQFTYGALPAPVTLQAYTSYYLVSVEPYGGDLWYDVGPVDVTTNLATVAGPVYSFGSNYVLYPAPGNAYVPLNFLYGSAASTPPPTVSIASPAPNAVISGKSQIVTAAAVAAPGLAIASVQFQVDQVNLGGPVAASPYSITLDTTTLTNGSHTLTAVATDSANNTATAPQINVTVANAVTTVSIAAPAAGAVISGKAVPVSATATAAPGLTISSVQFKVDGANLGAPVSNSPYSVTLDTTTLTNGSHTLTAVATDSANNTAAAPQITVTVANSVTTVSIAAPASNASVSGKAVPVSATATAATGLTISNVQFKVDGANLGAPVTNSPYSVTLDTTTLTNGSHTLTAVATDSANKTAASAPVSITVNNAPPVPSGTPFVTGGNFGGARNTAIGWIGYQLDVGSSPVTVIGLGRIVVAGNTGTHVVKLVSGRDSSDVPGGAVMVNTAGGTPDQFTYVSLPSPVTLQAYTSYFIVSQETYGGDLWYDSSALAVSTVASVAGPIYGLGTAYYLTPSPGYGYVPLSFLYGSAIPAAVPPTVSITAPAAGATVSGKTAAVSANATAATGLTISNVQFKVDGANIGAPVTASPYSVTLDTTTLSNAAHTLTAVATDSANNTASAQITITVANAVTTVSIVTPAAGATVSGKTLAVTANATAAAGLTISNVQFKVDGANIGAPVTASPYSVTLDTTTLSNAAHTLTAVATDSANATASAQITITVANAVTTVSIVAPAAGATVSGKTVLVSASATAAPGLTISNVQFKVDGANIGAPVTASPYSVTLDTTTLTNAAHTLTAVATDSANHLATSAPSGITVNNAPPPPSGTPFVTGVNFSTARNDAIGWIGYQLDVGSLPLTVSALGRIFIPGNSGTHTVKLVLGRDASDVPGGSVTVNMQGGTSGQFSYANLPGPVTLQAYTSYYLVSQEFYGGDLWYDSSAVTVSSLATVAGPVYSLGPGYYLIPSPGYAYVPLSFLYGR